jgi:hypothetical protein
MVGIDLHGFLENPGRLGQKPLLLIEHSQSDKAFGIPGLHLDRFEEVLFGPFSEGRDFGFGHGEEQKIVPFVPVQPHDFFKKDDGVFVSSLAVERLGLAELNVRPLLHVLSCPRLAGGPLAS